MLINKWSASQRSAEISYGVVTERLLERTQQLDDVQLTFQLYYFVKDFSQDRESLKNRVILFVAGGPGQIIQADAKNFVDMPGYRVVYFHLRGAGFSQIPSDPQFDQFLRTQYAVEDIDKIREDLKIDRWYGIIGHSYGAVLAQEYAHKYHDKVRRLVLSAPDSGTTRNSDQEPAQFTTLAKIYESVDFNFLDNDKKLQLLARVKAISDTVEKHFWNTQNVIDNFDKVHDQLNHLKIECRKEFFAALRMLRLTGWLPFDDNLFVGSDANVDTLQRATGLLIAEAILGEKTLRRLTRKHKTAKVSDATILAFAHKYFSKPLTQSSTRAYYVMSIYDGLNPKFLRELDDAKNDVRKAFANMSKKFHLEDTIGKIGIVENDIPQQWEPGGHPHSVPTLIIKGGADPITDAGQAEDYFEHGATKQRALMEFPGIGHAMSFPDFDTPLRINIGATRYSTSDSRAALVQIFLNEDFDVFKKSKIFTPTDRLFGDLLKPLQPVARGEPIVKREFRSES